MYNPHAHPTPPQRTPATSGHQLQNRQPCAAPHASAQAASESAVAAETSTGPRSSVLSDREKLLQMSLEAVGSEMSRVDRPTGQQR